MRDLAEREGISINQLIATAVAEKLAALMTMEEISPLVSQLPTTGMAVIAPSPGGERGTEHQSAIYRDAGAVQGTLAPEGSAISRRDATALAGQRRAHRPFAQTCVLSQGI